MYREAAECDAPPDYAILTSKVHASIDRVAILRLVVGRQTVILLIQNGVDIERDIAERLPLE